MKEEVNHSDKIGGNLRTVNKKKRMDSNLDIALTSGEDSERESHCISLDTSKTRKKRRFKALIKSEEHDRTPTENKISSELQEGNSPRKRKKVSAIRDDTICNELTVSSLQEEGKNLGLVSQLFLVC